MKARAVSLRPLSANVCGQGIRLTRSRSVPKGAKRLAGEVIHSQGYLKFLEHANSPRNLGMIANPSAAAKVLGICGDSLEVSLIIEDDKISDINYLPYGCVHTIACASAMSELAKGRSLEQALELGPEEIEAELGGLPETHKHCARLAVNALGEAIADYYKRRHGSSQAA